MAVKAVWVIHITRIITAKNRLINNADGIQNLLVTIKNKSINNPDGIQKE